MDERQRLLRRFGFCASKVIWESDPEVFRGCPQVAQVVLRALDQLGHSPVAYFGKGITPEGESVGHIWIELPDLELRFDTNPSQIFGYPMYVFVMDRGDYQDRYVSPEKIHEDHPGLFVTKAGEKYFNRVAKKVVNCYRKAS